MHGPSDEETDPCQNTPSPTPIPTINSASDVTIIREAMGYFMIVD